MIELTREEAESLFADTDVLHSHIEKMTSGFKIIFELADRRVLFLHYDTSNHHKSYFFEEAGSTPSSTGLHPLQ